MAGAAMSPPVFFQAHRGSVDEAPENTLSAFRHAWRFPGSIPETDIRTTADGALICLHDANAGAHDQRAGGNPRCGCRRA
ncbi:MAG: hypothetical protein HC802_14675 [Caldilineaceae bacterium]|nr:hypothetical protein [Caldilineaceae bacterium]